MKSSSIPYGYKIERGKAVINEEEAGRVRQLFSFYLSGLSIQKAKEAAEIDASVSTAGKMLQRKTYLGDDYYPPVIDRATFDAVSEERSRRFANPGVRKPAPSKGTVPVKIRFTVSDTNLVPKNPTPAQKAGFLYSLIAADPSGTEVITASDRSKLHNLAGR